MSIFKKLPTNYKVFFKNSYFLYISHFADYVLLLFFLPFIAKNIGAEEFGRISLSQTFGVLLVLLFEFGSPLFLTREVAVSKNDRSSLDSLIIKSILMKISLLPLCLVISIIAIFSVPVFKQNPFFIFLVFLGSFFQGISPIWYFSGLEKMKKIGLSKIIFRIIGFVLIVFFVRRPEESWIVLAGYSLTSFLICSYLLFEAFKEIKRIKLPSFDEIKNLYLSSSNSFFVTFFPVFFQNLSMMLLSLYVGPSQLGIFYGANRVYKALNSLYSPLGQALFPRISQSSKHNINKAQNFFKSLILFFLFFGVFMFIMILIFSNQIISILLGKDFLDSSNVLIALGSVLPLTALSHVLGRQWMMANNFDSAYMKIQLFSSLLSFIFFVLFINDFGIMSLPLSLIIYELSSILSVIIFLFQKDLKNVFNQT